MRVQPCAQDKQTAEKLLIPEAASEDEYVLPKSIFAVIL